MSFRLFLSLFFFSPIIVVAQTSPLPLNFKSYAIKLCVTKDENLILTTRAGEVGIAKSIKSDWRRAEPKTAEEYLEPLIDQANFFNKDTGFVSGFIQGKNGKYNIIYRTINGGIKWETINFGQDGWVDDAINLDNGEAWLSVSGSGIAYTRDYGSTWKKCNFPEVKQRFSTVFFNPAHEGLIGSLWNYLAYTQDNCENWKILPTPLDQKAYDKTNKQSRPAFDRVTIFGEYFLVKQEDLVFYSKKDSVKWKWMEEYNDFYTDPANSAIFFKTVKGNLVRADLALSPIFTYENVLSGYDSKCKNGSLFTVSDKKMQQLNPNNQIISALFTTNKSSGVEPITIGYTANGSVGVLDGKAYQQKDFNGKWNYLFDFPLPVDNGNITMTDDLVLFNRGDDSLFYFNLSGKEVSKKSKSRMVDEFCKAGMDKLIFSAGSQGCFHSYSDKITYYNKNGIFEGGIEESSGTTHQEGLADNDAEISGQTVTDFVSKIPSLFDTANFASVDDLGFTEKEYEQCKKDILDFKASIRVTKNDKETKFFFNRNNLNFDRLVGLVDSIKYLDVKRLNRVLFNLSEMWSTTTNSKEIQFINNKNETLSIICRYYEPNAFDFPWLVTLNGYSVATTNIEVNKFLRKAYPAFSTENDRVKILYRLVKNLY
jgi:hypothetical protein